MLDNQEKVRMIAGRVMVVWLGLTSIVFGISLFYASEASDEAIKVAICAFGMNTVLLACTTVLGFSYDSRRNCKGWVPLFEDNLLGAIVCVVLTTMIFLGIAVVGILTN